MSLSDVLYTTVLLFGVWCGWCFGLAQDGEGPFVRIGHWRNERAAAKTLRLLNATRPGPSMFFPWSPALRPPRES